MVGKYLYVYKTLISCHRIKTIVGIEQRNKNKYAGLHNVPLQEGRCTPLTKLKLHKSRGQ